jgi:internalin A
MKKLLWAEERIHLARTTRSTELNLVPEMGQQKLKQIPPEAFELKRLEVLKLWDNRIQVLPPAIGQLRNLRELLLSDNQLTALPNELARLKNLTSLGLSHNLFTSVPDVIRRLEKLENLYLDENRIAVLPNWLASVGNLQTIFLDGNPIDTPPLELVEKGITAIGDYFRQVEAEGYDYLYEAKLLIVGEAEAGKTTLARKIMDPKYFGNVRLSDGCNSQTVSTDVRIVFDKW